MVSQEFRSHFFFCLIKPQPHCRTVETHSKERKEPPDFYIVLKSVVS